MNLAEATRNIQLKKDVEVFQKFVVPIVRKEGAQKLLQSKMSRDQYLALVRGGQNAGVEYDGSNRGRVISKDEFLNINKR